MKLFGGVNRRNRRRNVTLGEAPQQTNQQELATELATLNELLRKTEIDRVSYQKLHEALGFSELFRAKLLFPRDLTHWIMELDDGPILKYIYRNFRPRRHLEFGTWQGYGIEFCLDESDATVWTLNLLEGERKSGINAYGNGISNVKDLERWAEKNDLKSIGRTDALGFIGWRYLSRNMGNRVCQIYTDSMNWDTSNYPPGFFDTVLIDGGHTEQVVRNDTQKALPLTRSGGLIMWHDFCPEGDVLRSCSSTRGVVAALLRSWEDISSRMSSLFWVFPSWLLVGIKK